MSRGYIRLAPQSGGSIQNPKVSNAANGMWFQYVGTLGDGDVLHLELLTQTVLVNDVADYEAFYISDTQAGHMTLEVGDNPITATADSLTGTVDFVWQWSRHYVL